MIYIVYRVVLNIFFTNLSAIVQSYYVMIYNSWGDDRINCVVEYVLRKLLTYTKSIVTSLKPSWDKLGRFAVMTGHTNLHGKDLHRLGEQMMQICQILSKQHQKLNS